MQISRCVVHNINTQARGSDGHPYLLMASYAYLRSESLVRQQAFFASYSPPLTSHSGARWDFHVHMMSHVQLLACSFSSYVI